MNVYSRRLFSTQAPLLARAPQNLVEKIVERHTVNVEEDGVYSGDFVTVKPAHVMTHDNTAAVMIKFNQLDTDKVASSKQIVFTLDHNVQDTSEKNLDKYKRIENFAKEQGINFYKAGRGIGHQVLCEEGYVYPNRMVVASDSHSNMYGGLGCLGTPVVRTDAAALWATSKTWWQVPPVAKVELIGELQPGVYGKDVIIALCGIFKNNEVLNHAVEFTGSGAANLDIDSRLTIANMTTEWGALAGLFPSDAKTKEWYKKRAIPRLKDIQEEDLQADPDAYYAKSLSIDLSTLEPHVCGPNSVNAMKSVKDISDQKIAIQKAYIVSCVNSRLSDLEEAAKIFEGKKVADGVELYVAAASSVVEEQSRESGAWKTLLDAGAIPLPPGCGPCIGLGAGLLKDGEVGISATNRNFKGRMGSPNADAYLASPAVVAASSVAGYITGPSSQTNTETKVSLQENTKRPSSSSSSVNLLDGFPSVLSASPLVCYENSINTDGIYPGKYTYKDDMRPDEMAKVVMENYDKDFAAMIKHGDLLIGGYNFGTGSSREQAVTALKSAGISLLIGGSFSETYKRNALNNGLLAIEVPELVDYLVESRAKDSLSKRFDEKVEVDFKNSRLTFQGQTYTFQPVGLVAQELVVYGGLEGWVNNQL